MNKPTFSHWCRLPARFPLTLSIAIAAMVVFYTRVGESTLEIHLQAEQGISLVKLLGCHVLHWSDQHLFWDLGMFVALGILCEQRMRLRFYGTLLVTAILVPLAVGIAHPNIDIYRGLSGIDTAIFSLLATVILIEGVREHDLLKCSVFAAWLLLLLKTIYEFASNGAMFIHEPNFTPIPLAHLVGSIVGLLAATCNISGVHLARSAAPLRFFTRASPHG